jgi:hypothetical protein
MLIATRLPACPIAVAVRLARAAVLSVLLQGCTASDWQPPTVMVAAGTSVTTIYPSAAVGEAPDVLPGAPPGLANVPPSAGQSVGRNGVYVGTADPLVTNGGLCGQTLRVEGFRVVGDHVRYGRFHGRIDPANGLQMAYGNQWLIGQFENGSFHGLLMTTEVHGRPGCTFMVSLGRIAG